MPPVGFEPTIAAGERPYTYALDRAATGTGIKCKYIPFYYTLDFTISIKHPAASCRLCTFIIGHMPG